MPGHESDNFFNFFLWALDVRLQLERIFLLIIFCLLLHITHFTLLLQADKSTIVDEAVSYIKKLQVTLQKLQKQKLERLRGPGTICSEPPMLTENAVTPNALTSNSTREAYLAEQVSSLNLGVQANASNSLAIVPTFPICFQTWSSRNVVLNVCGEDAHITVCAPKKFGLHTTIQCVLEKHNIDVITFTISSDIYRSMFMIHAHVSSGIQLIFINHYPFYFIE